MSSYRIVRQCSRMFLFFLEGSSTLLFSMYSAFNHYHLTKVFCCSHLYVWVDVAVNSTLLVRSFHRLKNMTNGSSDLCTC